MQISSTSTLLRNADLLMLARSSTRRRTFEKCQSKMWLIRLKISSRRTRSLGNLEVSELGVATIASQEPPPRRFIAGADAIATAEQKVADLKAQIDAYRKLSTSLDFDEV